MEGRGEEMVVLLRVLWFVRGEVDLFDAGPGGVTQGLGQLRRLGEVPWCISST